MLPPYSTNKSAAKPSDGFAVIPEYSSEPPHCKANVSSDNSDLVLSIELILGSSLITLL